MWNMVWSLAGTCPFHKVIKDMYEGKHGAKRMEHGKDFNRTCSALIKIQLIVIKNITCR